MPITDQLSKLQNHKWKILYLFIFVNLIILIYWIYTNYLSPRAPEFIPNNEFSSSSNQNTNYYYADLYLFYADWCPHSRKIFPKDGIIDDDKQEGAWLKIKKEFATLMDDEENISEKNVIPKIWNKKWIIRTFEVDGDKMDDINRMKQFEEKYLSNIVDDKGVPKEIDGYPTIYLVKKDEDREKVIEFEASPNYLNIKNWLINEIDGEKEK